jgi:FkbM family methyltransferase
MLTAAKQLGKQLFNVCGLEIRKKRVETVPRDSMRGSLRQISSLGFKPRTVIDVGAAAHTSELYEEFREAQILLIEPLVEFEPFLRKICASYKAQYVLAAAGERPGTAAINVHRDIFGSSLLKEVEGSGVDGSPREVPVVTLDQECLERRLEGPYLIKADVQGAELQVLAGAERTLSEAEVVILEVSLFGTMVEGPQFHDVVSYMKQHGFVVYDVNSALYRPLDHALAQLDLTFVRGQGLFRESHAYTNSEQREAHNRKWIQILELEKKRA